VLRFIRVEKGGTKFRSGALLNLERGDRARNGKWRNGNGELETGNDSRLRIQNGEQKRRKGLEGYSLI